ncbi:hypothetical protein BGZ99_005171 [Dissophora globulifera]|uniref:Hyaluronan-mediated motility receptor C-terminal domain-containing protein n=1 Tax=Dissophora globulifera TaxID=979702 RepID=A0A9P6V014_9FUNG|nr:hypothetical protein BGZ99_005171 [Dissophora globulifera]
MFPRSERFVEKIEITPGPNHYDVKAGEDDPYKRFGFLGKTKRFDEDGKIIGGGGSGTTPYERNSLSVSLPSLVIDDDGSVADTVSVHSNGSTTPDYTRRPPTTRSKSSDKLGLAFAANTNKVEERLKRELADLTDKFEKYRISRQRELEIMTEKQKKAETMYQSAVKDKSTIQTQLVNKESEIAELGVRHSMLKATLEKSERSASLVNDKIGKTNQLQKKVDELERILARTKALLDEQDSIAADARKVFDQERQQLQQQLDEQCESAAQNVAVAADAQRLMEQQHVEEMRRITQDSDAWKSKFENLERLFKELEQRLQAERRTVDELRAQMKQEREQMQSQIDRADETIRRMEREQQEFAAHSTAQTERLEQEKSDLGRSLQASQSELAVLSEKHVTTERQLEEQREMHSETVASMTRQYKEQQVLFEKEREEQSAARLELQQSIANLITELGQSRDTLQTVEMQREDLQGRYNQAVSDMQEMSLAKTVLEGDYERHKVASLEQQERWAAEREALSASLALQQQESDATIKDLKATVDQRQESLSRAMKSFDAIHAELKTVESQREEVIAQKKAEEQKSAEMLEKLSRLEQQNLSVSQQVVSLGADVKTLQQERDQLKEEVSHKDHSIKTLETEVELTTAEAKEREAQDQRRIQELEGTNQLAAKETDMLRTREKELESEKAEAMQDAVSKAELIGSLQSNLEQVSMEKEAEAKISAERIMELEARCLAMENAFQEMYNRSGSEQEIDTADSQERWQQHSIAILEVLDYHGDECSITKTEHAALLDEKSMLELGAATLGVNLREQGAEHKRVQADHSALLAMIAELEEQIRRLTAEVECLEADNIGKVAIIKALEDEYDYQERVIRDLSKNDDAAKEVVRLEADVQRLTVRARETEEWIKEVQEDNDKYRKAYVKADIAREETLLDMVKLHEDLAESEQARLQVENQLQVEVNTMIKKHGLSNEELSRLSKMNVESAQSIKLRQKFKQVAQLKEEMLGLKKKNLSLANARDSLRLKCLQIERNLEAFKASNPGSGTGYRSIYRTHSSSVSSVVSSSSVTPARSLIESLGVSDQGPGGKLQLLGLVPAARTNSRSRSVSPGSVKSSTSAGGSSSSTGRPPMRSRAARSFMAGH